MWMVVLLVFSLASGDLHPFIWPTPFETQQACEQFIPEATKKAAEQFDSRFTFSVACQKAPPSSPPGEPA